MTESTTIRVSKDSLHTATMDQTIEALVKGRRREVLDTLAGTDRVKTRRFTEEDRLEDRS